MFGEIILMVSHNESQR